MAWSIPEGYEIFPSPDDPGVKVVVATHARSALLLAGIQDPEKLSAGPAVSEWIDGGRIRHPVFRAGNERWLLKAYRRGGLVPLWNTDRYWSPRRFLRELETAVWAVHTGVPAPETIALVLRRAGWGGAFRAWQVVRYLSGVKSLRDVLQGDGASPRCPGTGMGEIFRAAGVAVRQMHDARIDHPDLNLGNILTRPPGNPGDGRGDSPAPAEAFIIDWDRARLRPAGSWNPHRNLFRLWRSVLKQVWASRRIQPPRIALHAFLRGYFGHDRPGIRRLRRYIRPRLGLLNIHAFFWSLGRIRKLGR